MIHHRTISFLLLSLLSGLICSAQSIGGTVLNEEDGKPIPGAVVRMVGKKGTLSYKMTTSKGGFLIAAPADADSLIVSLLGYEKQAFVRPFKDNYQIRLVPSNEQIEKSVVIARKVEMAGDTIRYNVKSLRIQEDHVLSDVLNRLPGVEVSPAGYVKYYGRAISKFYVDGRDVLQSNYNLATRNLPVEAVKSVEVLENHQPVKMLQGVKSSDRAALNIVLDEKSRAKLTGSIAMGAGLAAEKPRFPLAGRFSAFYMGRRFSSVNVLGYDSQGFALQEAEASGQADRSYYHYNVNDYLRMVTSSAPLENKRSLFNNTADASSVEHFSLSETQSADVSIKYTDNRLASLIGEQSIYKDPVQGETLIDRTEDGKTHNRHLAGILSYTDNSPKHYYYDKLYSDFMWDGGVLSVNGGLDRHQSSTRRKWNVENEATFSFRNNARMMSIGSFTQFSGNEEQLMVNERNQDIHSSLFHQRLILEGMAIRRNGWTFGLTPEVMATVFKRSSCLMGLEDNTIVGKTIGTSSVMNIRGGASAEIRYAANPWEVIAGAVAHYAFCQIGKEDRTNYLQGNASAQVRYVTGRWEMTIAGQASLSGPDIQSFGEAVILTGYNTLWKGRSSFLVTPRWEVDTEIKYREPISGWSGIARASLNGTRGITSARELYESYILNFQTDKYYHTQSFNAGMELSKGMFSLNGKLTASVDYSRSSSVFRQNDRDINYVSAVISPALSVTASFIRWWGIATEIRAYYYRYTADGLANSENGSFTAKWKNTFRMGNRLSGSLSMDLYYHSAYKKAVLFPDVALIWKGDKGLRVRLEASNLLNITTYSYVTLSPLLENHMIYRIRPLTVLLGLDWQF